MHTRGNTTKTHITYKGGFSLVELMVSLTIFSIVMTASVGALFILIDANAKAQALYTSTTNLSFAVDSITRNLRMGYNYYCDSLSSIGGSGSSLPSGTKSCLSPGNTGIAFNREKDGKRIGYRLVSGSGSGEIQMKEDTGSWLRITSGNVVITKFNIIAVGTEGVYSTPSDAIQPRISVLIEGYVNNGLENNTDFRLQTNVIQRTLNYY